MNRATSRSHSEQAQPFLVFENDRATISLSDERICNEANLVERVIAYAFDVLDVHYIELRVMPGKPEPARPTTHS
ncbi:MAG TPA: hypothetical protein VFT99_14485 [Roseiflexaceae bacterium]|nr:hypothetical protein [Roseiflexaceae bacterium]